MKHIGTLSCFLFGHKFLDWSGDKDDGYRTFPVDFCVRCGIKREDLNP